MKRMRRNRIHPGVRRLVHPHRIHAEDLILPIFVKEGIQDKEPIVSMPGHHQWSLEALPAWVETLYQEGVRSILLFGIPKGKDAKGSAALRDDGIIQSALKCVKKTIPDMLCIVDLCLCEYTDHGHCGLLHPTCGVDDDASLPFLVKQALSLVEAGADVIAPSGMLDGAVDALRGALDQAGHIGIPVMSYAIKYASAFYGPFREAAEGAPAKGDRRQYQMDPAQGDASLLMADQALKEGADMLIVKPGALYGDVIYRVTQSHPGVPVGAYHVSGEYASLKALARDGLIDERAAVMEVHEGLKRAGAHFIITYYAREILSWLQRTK